MCKGPTLLREGLRSRHIHTDIQREKPGDKQDGRHRAMAALVAAGAVAHLLRDRATRAATLDALEGHEFGAIDRAVSLAAAPALVELLAADAAEVDREVFDRAGLLVGRLFAEEAPEDLAAMYGAAFGEGRFAAYLRSEGSVVGRVWRTPASELTRADARSWACMQACVSPSCARGCTKNFAAAGFATTLEYFAVFMTETPVVSKCVGARVLAPAR
eukprot:COSAG06_NODE_7432_length_2507_cov_113.101329_2_plen_216_part_00